MTAIKNKDPKLLKSEEFIFKDEDFEKGAGMRKKEKAFTLKDQIRKDALKKMSDSDDDEDVSDGSDSDGEGETREKQRAKESNLFTKIGVPQQEE